MENSVGDLISRERLRKMIKATKQCTGDYVISAYWTGYVVALSTLEGLLAGEPSVDAVPVVHGRWIKPIGMMMPPEHHGRHRCSVCDQMAFYERPGREGLSDYCPNCGARMDGGSNV